MTEGGRRLLLVVVLVGLFGGIAVADRLVSRNPGTPASEPRPPSSPGQIAPTGVESAAWYCAGGTAAPAWAVPTLLLTNTSARAVSGMVTAVSPGAQPASAPVLVPAHGTVHVSPAALGGGSEVAATVLLDGGGVGAWEQVAGPAGWSVSPCASVPGMHWYFAHGSTRAGDALVLALYNPGATDAVVDVTLLTSTGGVVAPAAYQGIDVAPRSYVVENVGDHVLNDPSIAAEVSALSGTLVAFERQSTGEPGAGGMSLVIGTPAPARRVSFAQSTDPTGGAVTYYLMNPSNRQVSVAASIGLQHGSAAPLSLSVPAQGTAALSAGSQTRIPPDTPYSITFTSTDPGIVVGRAVSAAPGTPSPQVGIADGVPPGPRRWVVPPVPSPGTGAWYLAVVDLAGRPVSVTVRRQSKSGWSPVAAASGRVIPGVPLLLGPNPPAPIGTSALEVLATGPVVVQLDAVPAGAPGVIVVPALVSG